MDLLDMFETSNGDGIPVKTFMATSPIWGGIKSRYYSASDEDAAEVVLELENVVAEYLRRLQLDGPEGTEEAVVVYAISGDA